MRCGKENCASAQPPAQRDKAWGENRHTSGSMPTSYRFTGQREDTTGLYFYNARYYDPVVGRFAQADTIVPQPGNPQSFNRYSYTLNNPVKYRDPSGHVVETAWDIANVAWDIHEFANDRSVGNFVALALDAGAVLLPFVPAGAGLIIRGGKIADKAIDAAKVVAKGDKLADAAKHADDILPEAYKVAKEGGQHAGTLRTYAKRSSNEIAKSIRSFQKQVDEHLDKLANPETITRTGTQWQISIERMFSRNGRRSSRDSRKSVTS